MVISRPRGVVQRLELDVRRRLIKRYIGYFPEIRDLPKDQQSRILEKARYEAFVSLRLTGRVALYFLLSLGLGFAIVLFGQMVLDLGSRMGFVTVAVAAVIALIVYRKLYATLLYRGLRKYLDENPQTRQPAD